MAKPPLSPNDINSVHQLLQSGQLALAAQRAQALLAQHPKSLPLLNLLGMSQQALGQWREAAASFRKMLAIDGNIAEIHFNLACLYTQLNDYKAAISTYLKALQLKPQLTVAHFNLGSLYQQQNRSADAVEHYRIAVQQQPGYHQAWVNLGAVLQNDGQLQQAEQCYRQALNIQADAPGFFNLGTVLYDQGQLDDAIGAFRACLDNDPQFADAWNDLGEIYRDRAEMGEAVRCYREALRCAPQHARAHYNLGESYCLGEQFAQAVPHFSASDFADAQERVLLCLYKTRQFEVFEQRLAQFVAAKRHQSVLLASLSTHYALNFKREDPYRFCREPMAYVQLTHIEQLAQPDSPLLAQLLHDVRELAIAERKQGRLYYGIQSAGNLLQRSEDSFQQLAALIRDKVEAYRRRYADSEEALIRQFPKQLEFASSWYLRMKKGGYLSAHIHEEGWISGCVYLQLPDKAGGHEGSFEYGTDGDDYPKLHQDFPNRIVDQQVGDLVLFPSSLFHRTLPFHSDQERVCIAFDIKPALAR
jgi:uncharacterized protein (TIGR02466 family)